MNSTIDAEIPAAPPVIGDGDGGEPFAVVAVKVTIPIAMPEDFSSGNIMGTIVLFAAFKLALESQHLFDEAVSIHVGPLNDSYFIFSVPQAEAAVALLESVLKAAAPVDTYATVLIYSSLDACFVPRGHDGAGIGSAGFTVNKMRGRSQADRESLTRAKTANANFRAHLRKVLGECGETANPT